ncbi:aldehyde dehydrogenase family protein [Bradyrhizobium sp. LHD-71]|uniref:L-piperidine-6-carboxylate dehydrogenase n=1 Tax=Bradyrhizobium sp. LHD-71 TaxID=3072141 RepID=UPI00280E5727|nr:aldehyde dehydrogenase family protein [Bradyrhizobium sp. LHD-71]MDQ8732335.1 aldehyde dehydrogenase family protein [Bradyrhizobium sp. LHD-71]
MNVHAHPGSLAGNVASVLEKLGVPIKAFDGGTLAVRSPITGEVIAQCAETSAERAKATIGKAAEAFRAWRTIPAPRRGELIRLFAAELRAAKAELAQVIAFEVGKVSSEALGEVQEMIDIADFAVGLSRQLHGVTLASERANHRMTETWHPLGVTGIISAFNFPAAVWSWNVAIGLVCGNSCVWKPSEKTPLSALASQAIFERAARKFGGVPDGLSSLIIGGAELGELLVDDVRVPLVSATGSTSMGRKVGPRLAQRFARMILELGGNNASIVCPSADLDLTARAVAFSTMGTAGQRCTTLRRLFVHESVYDKLVPRLVAACASVRIGDPRDQETLVGPLIDKRAFDSQQQALQEAKALGASISGGERVMAPQYPDAYYVRPAIVEMPSQAGPMLRETFAPILYVVKFKTFEVAIQLQNATAQGLTSSIFTTDMREAEFFLSDQGSDCGIANVNIGPSGAEIGGAFGGEKESGIGREAGSDAWKNYMRRATNTVNYGRELPLAQGVTFDVA